MYCNISVIICLVYFIFTCSWIRDSIYCITYSIKMKENSALVKPFGLKTLPGYKVRAGDHCAWAWG